MRFLSSIKPELRNSLVNEMDPARVVALLKFQDFLRNWSNPIESIAIVSGSLAEPELNLISEYSEVTVLSFEKDPALFDLNKDWSQIPWSRFHDAFDLVLCEQVLEHVIHPDRAIRNLGHILKPGGLLHVTVPAINNSHGEPFYYYAGFPASTLKEHAESSGLIVFDCGSWKSNKASRMYSTCDWSPISQSGSFGQMLLGCYMKRNSLTALFSIFLGRIRNFFVYPFQILFTVGRHQNSVVTWLFAGKTDAL